MNEIEALTLAIEALETRADESFTARERAGDPEIQSWFDKQYDAADLIRNMMKEK